MTKTAVVISTYNRPKALHLVLLGISQQVCRPDQIVIGDDGSTDSTKQVIEDWKFKGLPIEHCWHPDEGYRKTIVMNQAFSKVKSELSIFLDGDCIPGPTFVEDHIKLHEHNTINAGPRILANQALSSALEATGSGTWFSKNLGALMWDRLLGRVNRIIPLLKMGDGAWRRARPQKWQLVRGCNFSVPTDAIWRVDGFEESLFGWGPDDSDLAVRLINAGYKVKSARFACPVLHLWHKEESRHGLERNRAYLEAAIRERRVRAIRGLSSHGWAKPIS